MGQKWRHRCAARAVLVLITLLGLVGMHGLPDAMASLSGARMVSAGAAMSPTLPPGADMTVAMRQSAPPRHHADPAARHPVHGPHDEARPWAPSSAAPVGCAMDHTNCVAVLREPGRLTSSGPALIVAAGCGVPMAALVWTPARSPRALPDVSLIALGISRT